MGECVAEDVVRLEGPRPASVPATITTPAACIWRQIATIAGSLDAIFGGGLIPGMRTTPMVALTTTPAATIMSISSPGSSIPVADQKVTCSRPSTT